MGELTRANIRKLIRNYVKADLEEFNLEQATGQRGNDNSLGDDLGSIDTGLDHSKRALAMRRHVEFMSKHVDHLLEDAGLEPVKDKGSEEYQVLCREMLRANIRLLEANQEVIVGNFKGHDTEFHSEGSGLGRGED